MPGPRQRPIGLQVSRTAKALARAFDDAMAAAGGATSTWLVLLSLKTGATRTQADLATAVGVRGPTMTHHLDGLEQAGLVTRERVQGNRRVQQVSLTDEGEAMFDRLRQVAVAFDRRLRAGLSAAEEAELRRLLDALESNVGRPS
ncbi:MAG: MarR family transcriptional regulator [Actinomycetota bacterium]|nr:MarR family transcriptional regulator [Actinomycetota bacterium]